MKKNNFMRIASVLMVLTLLSTCAISGTFAKYVTSDGSKDEARVAHFGVVVSATDDSNFETEYINTTNGLTVKSSSAETVVAPGTSGTAIKFAITGTPEVATKIDIDMTITSDIHVKSGEHLNWTTGGDTTDIFDLTDAYYPVVFTLVQTSAAGVELATPVEIAKGNLEAIKTALTDYAATATYAPNTNLGAEFELNWAWNFDTNDNTTNVVANNNADTLLGNVIAGTATDSNVVTKIAYEITFTVTQVD